MRTVLTVMIGITAMGPAEVDVLSYLRLSVLGAVAAVRPWVAICGAARAAAAASIAVASCGVVHTNLCIGGRQALSEFIILAL